MLYIIFSSFWFIWNNNNSNHYVSLSSKEKHIRYTQTPNTYKKKTIFLSNRTVRLNQVNIFNYSLINIFSDINEQISNLLISLWYVHAIQQNITDCQKKTKHHLLTHCLQSITYLLSMVITYGLHSTKFVVSNNLFGTVTYDYWLFFNPLKSAFVQYRGIRWLQRKRRGLIRHFSGKSTLILQIGILL